MLIRPIAHSDLDTLYQIAVESGPGFTSLMPDRDALTRKIEHSVASFNRSVSTPGDEHYLFVLEDETTGEIMGTTGIEAAVGHAHPLYHFHRNTVTHHSRDLGLRHSVETLSRCNHYSGCTEVCSLYLRPEFRRPNAGKLLSRVRFLFMGLHPERFSDTVIAEMRGVSDDEGRSPFWDWMQAHFVDMEFAEVTRLISSGNTDFIEELMPSHPLYTCLLSPEAQGVLSEVHEKTRPALHMLTAEGFRHKGFVDLFDGGPTVECKLPDIRSVQESEHWSVEIEQVPTNDFQKRSRTRFDSPLLVTNTETAGFRATVLTGASTRAGSRTLCLTPAQAKHLNLQNGSVCRVLPLTSQSKAMPAATEHTRAEVNYAH
ncbi:arginine N-succinyltransferase [Marinobacter salinisoli]|uniref:Arginine N-succinyltransferase n=1 Tax=Marinobacter salinisoli TaxID=2769486 RepID=A0ABX7MWY7_9GAMM|nr:arginine N-succinyltransferase [Marinobacter salinisoli]QSP94713.1 arginine N-succinyltransferase [Marinobacter salinisoli]